MKACIFISCLFCFGFLKVTAQNRMFYDSTQRDKVAENTLHNFMLTLRPDNVVHFGFRSVEELKNSALSTPFEISVVSVEQLKNYNSSTNVNTMLIQTPIYIYPIINSMNKEVINAMMVDNPSGGHWKMVSMGRDKDLANAIYLQARLRPDNYFIVSISAFHSDFIAYHTNNALMMIPVKSDPRNKLDTRRPEPAQHIFSVYSQEAKRYNGLPM